MKKLFSIILAFTLVMSMSMVAFATEADQPKVDQASINIDKFFELTNAGTVSPAENFSFSINKVGVTDSSYNLGTMPTFGENSFNVSFDQGEATSTKSATLTLPTYNATGVFAYELTETQGNTAGVTYDGRTLVLTVYVFNDSNGGFIRTATLHDKNGENPMKKVSGFKNEFSAGALAISKDVTGNMGQKERYFPVTVTFTGPTGENMAAVPVTYSGGQYVTPVVVTFAEGQATATFDIKHDDTITFHNLPYGVSWTIAEGDVTGDGYTTSYTNKDGTINSASAAATITNHKDRGIDTGVILDNAPYILLLIVAAGGLIVFSMRKRLSNNE